MLSLLFLVLGSIVSCRNLLETTNASYDVPESPSPEHVEFSLDNLTPLQVNEPTDSILAPGIAAQKQSSSDPCENHGSSCSFTSQKTRYFYEDGSCSSTRACDFEGYGSKEDCENACP